METFAWKAVTSARNDVDKAKLLYDALARHAATGAVAGQHYRTAQEVFASLNAPGASFLCEELAYAYVALARAVGLKAYTVFVEEGCYGAKNLHACAAVFVGKEAILVDHAYSTFGAAHKKFKILDDLETMAVYLSGMAALKPRQAANKLAPELYIVHASLFDKLAGGTSWREAKKQAAAMKRLNPGSPITFYAQGVTAFHEGRREEPVELIRKAILEAPQTPQFHALLGYIYSAEGKLVEARECYSDALQYSMDEHSARLARQAIADIEAAPEGSLNSPGDSQQIVRYAATILLLEETLRAGSMISSSFNPRGWTACIPTWLSRVRSTI